MGVTALQSPGRQVDGQGAILPPHGVGDGRIVIIHGRHDPRSLPRDPDPEQESCAPPRSMSTRADREVQRTPLSESGDLS